MRLGKCDKGGGGLPGVVVLREKCDTCRQKKGGIGVGVGVSYCVLEEAAGLVVVVVCTTRELLGGKLGKSRGVRSTMDSRRAWANRRHEKRRRSCRSRDKTRLDKMGRLVNSARLGRPCNCTAHFEHRREGEIGVPALRCVRAS